MKIIIRLTEEEREILFQAQGILVDAIVNASNPEIAQIADKAYDSIEKFFDFDFVEEAS